MNFKIDDILNDTVDGISKDALATVISEVIDEEDIVLTVDENQNLAKSIKRAWLLETTLGHCVLKWFFYILSSRVLYLGLRMKKEFIKR